MRPLLVLAIALSCFMGACQGCSGANPGSQQADANASASLRLYLLSTVAGALEPCGCSKDQLGGLDHVAAYIAAERASAPPHLLLSAGPLLYIDPKLASDHATQDRWKADAIALVMKDLGLGSWSPGFNDWASGGDALAQTATASGAVMLGVGREAGLGGPIQAAKMFEVGGVKVGVVGVSDPRDALGKAPDGVTLPDPSEIVARVKAEVGALQQQGARILVVTAAMQRGAALRIADAIPALHLLVVGHALSNGPANTSQPPPELLGSTLVVETANHAQTLGVVDIHLRGGDGPVVLADADGVQKAAKIAELSQQILALEARINSWEKGGTVDPKDLAARKSDLARLSQERSALERPSPAPEGSHFRYRVEEVREGLGSDATVTERMKAFYKRVNEHNKTAFADLKPLAPTEGEAHYVGADACTDCHSAAREVWDKTGHARAYATLEKDFKEYNLECVSCHVTGYGKPGGSTVTHVSSLKDVQCETCHGPGSKHIEEPEDASRIIKTPDPKTCVEQCHHPPHVDGFDPVAKMDLVLGPGHGKPQ